ncbi:hypothetical protein AWM70_13175 [Paenibacillus yonginensis]|uniref:Uncharacterized protein n=1 Tax=Paenibacillus yonginensis TaxID=1462996 RepID=A0A1B1N1Y2_9BACL|nr:hypothetical protein AWM70_13175 [Paenibacillus yonginensis]
MNMQAHNRSLAAVNAKKPPLTRRLFGLIVDDRPIESFSRLHQERTADDYQKDKQNKDSAS